MEDSDVVYVGPARRAVGGNNDSALQKLAKEENKLVEKLESIDRLIDYYQLQKSEIEEELQELADIRALIELSE